MSKIKRKWNRIIAAMMAVFMILTIIPGAFSSYAADETATPGDTSQMAYVRIKAAWPDDLKKEDMNVSGIVYEIYEDPRCEKQPVGSFVLSCDGKAYSENGSPVVYTDQKEIVKENIAYLELPAGEYYYQMAEKLYMSEKQPAAQHIFYDDQVYAFSLSAVNTVKKKAVILKPELHTSEDPATPTDIATKSDTDEETMQFTDTVSFVAEMINTAVYGTAEDYHYGEELNPVCNWYYADWLKEMRTRYPSVFNGSYNSSGRYYSCAQWVWDYYISSSTVKEAACLKPTDNNTASTGAICATLDKDTSHWMKVAEVSAASGTDEQRKEDAVQQLFDLINRESVQAGDIIVFKRNGSTNHIGILSAEHRDSDGTLGIWQSNGSKTKPSKTGLATLYWTATLDGDSAGADGFLIYRKKRENEGIVSIRKTLDGTVDDNIRKSKVLEGLVFKLYKVEDKNSEWNSAGSIKIGEFTVDANGVGVPTMLTADARNMGVEMNDTDNMILKLPYGTYLMEEDGASLVNKNMTKAEHQYCELSAAKKTANFVFDNKTADYSSVCIQKRSTRGNVSLDEYNMAGIVYKFFEKEDVNGSRVYSLVNVNDGEKHVSVNKIVLSYDGKAYMDKSGKNIIFTNKAAKALYKNKNGDNSVREFRFYVDTKYCKSTIYCKESKTLQTATESNYYYYNENGGKTYANAGQNLKASGFKLNSAWYAVKIPDQKSPQTQIINATDAPMLGKIRVSKEIANGSVSLAQGVLIWLERKAKDGEWEHIGTYEINDKGTGIPVAVTKAGTELGISAGKANLLNIPFGTYRVIEHDTKGLVCSYPASGYYKFTISEDNFDDDYNFKNNLIEDAGYVKLENGECTFQFTNKANVKVKLSKESKNAGVTGNANIYNMAGIKYMICDSDGKAASSIAATSAGVQVSSATRFVLSYNGKAYMDEDGINIVFVSAESKRNYEDNGGELHQFIWVTDQTDQTFYYMEAATLMADNDSGNAYYYHESRDSRSFQATEDLIRKHSGADVSVTGFIRDDKAHKINFANASENEKLKMKTIDCTATDDHTYWGRFELNKESTVPVTQTANKYNMAGIRYGIYNTDNDSAAAVTSSEHITAANVTVRRSNMIVLSYNGMAYMDDEGRNIVFVSKAAKDHYTDSDRSLYIYRWYKHGLTDDAVYYYHELSMTLDKSADAAGYYYDDGTKATRDLIDDHSGKAVSATGFEHDPAYYKFEFKFDKTAQAATALAEVAVTAKNKPLFWGKFRLTKQSAISAVDLDYYNMAGIQYRIYDGDKSKNTDANAVLSSAHTTAAQITVQRSHTIVLSYDGNAYMDDEGKNIVFVNKAAKDHYKNTANRSLYYYRWYKHGLTENTTYYYHELTKTLDKSGSTAAYYYHVEKTSKDYATIENMINEHGGTDGASKPVSVTGYKHDPAYYPFTIEFHSDGTEDTIEKTTTDEIYSCKARATKTYKGGNSAELKGVKFNLYKVSGDGAAYKDADLIADYIHNGTGVVANTIKQNNNLGIQKGTGTEAAYFKNLPYGWYCLAEDFTTARERGFSVADPVYLKADKDHTTLNFSMADERTGLRLRKQLDDNDMKGLCNYSLAGAEYQAYITTNDGVEATDKYVCTFTTDANGEGYISKYDQSKYYTLTDVRNGHAYKLAGIPVDSWIYIKETKPSAGCDLDTKSYFLHFTADDMTHTVVSTEPVKNDLLRIGVLKKDSISDQTSGASSLEGAEFTIRYYDVGTDAVTTYEQLKGKKPARTWVYKTDANGEIHTDQPDRYLIKDLSSALFYDKKNSPILPFGVVTIQETKAPSGYTLKGSFYKDSETEECISNDDGIIFVCVKNKNSLTSYLGENSVIKKETALRGDIRFKKVSSDTGKPLSGIAFKITSNTTKESHIVVTDENGMIDTSKIRHSKNTNAADNERSGFTSISGIWFYGNADCKGEVDDTLGALPYDSYTIEELATDTNEHYRLITPITVDLTNETMYLDGYCLYDLGTVTNVPEPSVGTRAMSTDTEDNIVPADSKVDVNDICEYRFFETGKTYTMKGIIMDPATGKPFVQADGTLCLGHVTFTVPDDDSGYHSDTVEVPFTIDTTGMEGKDVVAAEYVFEGEDDSDLALNEDGSIDTTGVLTTHTGSLIVHTDLSATTQTLSVPKIGTTAAGIDTDTHFVLNSGIIRFKDIVTYTNVISGRTYELSAVVIDKKTGKPLCDVDGNEITATAEFTPEDRNGSTEVEFTCDASRVDFRDKAIVLFEELRYNKITLAVHADILDERQTLYFPDVTSVLAGSENGDKSLRYSKKIKITDIVRLSNVPKTTAVTKYDEYGKAYNEEADGAELTITDVLYNRRTKQPLMIDGEKVSSTIHVFVSGDDISYSLDFTFDGTKTDLYAADGTLSDIVAFVYVYDDKGKLIAKEEDFDNADQMITFEIPKTEVKVNKVWDDNNDQDGIRPDNVSMQLYKGNDIAVGSPVILSDTNNWSYVWRDLAAENNTETIRYYVKEVNVPDEYSCKVAGTDEKNGFSYTVTNTHKHKQKPDKTVIRVNKIWADDAGYKRPESVEVQLYKNKEEKVGSSVKLSEKNNWLYEWTDLDKTENGKEISYFVDETEVPDGYVKTVTNEGTTYTIRNTYISKKQDTGISVVKVWDDNDDQDGIRPESIKVQLYKDKTEKVEKVITLSEENDWSYTWKDLPATDNGKQISYLVDEVEIPAGYTKTVSAKGTAFTIKNVHKPEKINASVIKIWDDNNDQDGIRPETVKVQLFADDEPVGKTVELTENNNWKYEWNDLDQKKDGTDIVYTVDEVEVPAGYEKKVTDKKTVFTITNIHKPGTTQVKVTKIWKDSDNKDRKRPESIEVQLYKTIGNKTETVGDPILLTEAANWTYIWTDLNKQEKGINITYVVDEVNVPDGYHKTIAKETEKGLTGFIITNSRPDVPKTGDTFRLIPIMMAMAAACVTGILIIWKKKRRITEQK